MVTLDKIKPGTRMFTLATTDLRYRERWQKRYGLTERQANELWPWHGAALRRPLEMVEACTHRGRESRRIVCRECSGHTEVKVYECRVYGECTIKQRQAGVAGCCDLWCKDYDAGTPEWMERPVPRLSVFRFDRANLSPQINGYRFNASVLRHGGRLFLAWRNAFAGSRLFLTEIADADEGEFSVIKTWPLRLDHQLGRNGQDDPMLFAHRGRLHVAYHGVFTTAQSDRSFKNCVANILYAELVEDGGVFAPGRIYYPDFAGRASWEKSWAFFEHADKLYAIYSFHPFRVLRIDGSNCEEAYRSGWETPWQGGVMRGGAAPVLVGDRYYAWFHGARDVNAVRTYSTGVMTFSADPPFRPLACTRWPVAVPDIRDKPKDCWANVTFVRGAVYEGGVWTVSSGEQDRWTTITRWRGRDIDAALEPV